MVKEEERGPARRHKEEVTAEGDLGTNYGSVLFVHRGRILSLVSAFEGERLGHSCAPQSGDRMVPTDDNERGLLTESRRSLRRIASKRRMETRRRKWWKT